MVNGIDFSIFLLVYGRSGLSLAHFWPQLVFKEDHFKTEISSVGQTVLILSFIPYLLTIYQFLLGDF